MLNDRSLNQFKITSSLLGKAIGVVLLFTSLISNIQASVIPDEYTYAPLPQNSLGSTFSAYLGINNNGLAVGYGTFNNKFGGFVYDFVNKQVITLFEDFIPLRINDSNTIAGIDFSVLNYPISTCVISAGACVLRPIQGAEQVGGISGFGLSNSNVVASSFLFRQADEQYRLYRNGKLIYNVLTASSPDRDGQIHYEMQRNNTRLLVGAFVNANGIKRPFVKILGSDGNVKTLNLPTPDSQRSAVATNVNGRNDIIISTIKDATQASSLYLCRFVGSQDNLNNESVCDGGLIYLGDSEFDGFGINQIALNDQGLLVTPGSRTGFKVQLYDLTQAQPIPIPLASKGTIAELFATEAPVQVNNNGVILAAPTKVLLIPVKAKAPFAVDIKQDNIQIPYDGTRMQFTETITNTSKIAQYLSYWRILNYPDGTPYSRSSVKRIQLDPGAQFVDSRVRLGLRSYMPTGTYEYRLYVMDGKNGKILSDKFVITKLP